MQSTEDPSVALSRRNAEHRAIAASYGRWLRKHHQELLDGPGGDIWQGLEEGAVDVRGIGMVPVPVLFALADLEDAEAYQRADPDDPDGVAAVRRATAAVAAAVRRTQPAPTADPGAP